MTNPLKGEVRLKLSDKREFLLVADHAGLVEAAQAYSGTTKLRRLLRDMQPELDEDGKAALDEDGDLKKDTIPATAAFLKGLLSAHHSELTLRDATNILLGDTEVVSEAIARAVEIAFPDTKEGRQSANPPKKPGSKPSGRSGAKQG